MIRMFGDPGYRLLNVALLVGAVGLSLCIAIAACAIKVDDFIYSRDYQR